MERTYIQFQMSQKSLNKEEESLFSRSIKNVTVSVLSRVFPVANPDFESKIEEVQHWLVECNTESGIPLREVGLNANGQVILKMPFKDNYGYWTDNNLLLDDFI